MKPLILLIIGLILSVAPWALAENGAGSAAFTDVWPTGRSFSAEGRMVVFGDDGDVENATLRIESATDGSTTRRTYSVVSGKGAGDRYEVVVRGSGPAATRERTYFNARKGRSQPVEGKAADRDFLGAVFTLRDLDGGFEPWPARSVLTRAVVGGVAVEVHVAQVADVRSQRRLGYLRFMNRVSDGALIQHQRFDRKDRLKTEVRYSNWTDVDGVPIAMKWEADEKSSSRRAVINWSGATVKPATGTPTP